MDRSRDLVKLLTVLVVIAALRLGEALLMPLALAMLVAFSLAPLVTRLERRRLGRAPAVILVCVFIATLLGGIGWVVGHQAAQLSVEIPTYRTVLHEKIRDLRGPIGSLAGAAEEITELGETIDPGANTPKVAVVEQGVLGTVGNVLTPLLGTLGTIGLVVVLALFMLLAREELRDRMIWLIGASDLSVTTRALDDAGQRVSRYLAMHSLLNAMHGIAVTIGLLAIGVPGAALWGTLAFALRFLPYFGPWIAASVPTLLAVLAFHGWQEPMLTFALFVSLELVSNNVLEPWLYGSSVGLSPFGIVFSAVFWAWLWGIPGLLVATPLTVCLVVAGRYVRGFQVFPALLGDAPVLAADVRLYQRLLALDTVEAATILNEAVESSVGDQLSDQVVLPVLRRLASDDQRDAFPEQRTTEMRERLAELLDELISSEPPEGVAVRARVLFVPALDECDSLAGRWLAHVSASRGIDATFASPHSLASELVAQVTAEAPDAVCISALTLRAASQARHLCKRLELAKFDCDRIVGVWAAPPHERPNASGAAERTSWIATASDLDAALQRVRGRSGEARTLRSVDRDAG